MKLVFRLHLNACRQTHELTGRDFSPTPMKIIFSLVGAYACVPRYHVCHVSSNTLHLLFIYLFLHAVTFPGCKIKVLNTFPVQWEIIIRSALGDMCGSEECWEAWFHFASLKKKTARSSCGPQTQHIWAETRSRQKKVMLWFTFPGSKTQKSEERKRNEGRTERGGTEEDSQGRGRDIEMFLQRQN